MFNYIKHQEPKISVISSAINYKKYKYKHCDFFLYSHQIEH